MLFGFQAGGQFAHRFAFFKPMLVLINCSSSSVFTMPTVKSDFPYE